MRKRRKINTIYKVVVIIAVLLLIFVGFSFKLKSINNEKKNEYGTIKNAQEEVSEKIEVDENEDKLKEPVMVTIFNVGQGLSVYIDAGKKELLYDCGPSDSGKIIANKIKGDVDNELDYVIISHSHEDHVGGYKDIAKNFNIGTTIYGDTSNSPVFKEFEKYAKKKSKYKNDENEVISLADNVSFSIFDITDNDSDTNNNSVLGYLQAGDSTFLLTGDADKKIEKTLNGKIPENIDVVIAGHHGSSKANYFLMPTSEYNIQNIVFSYGKDNEYGHPHKEVMNNAKNKTSNIYTTPKGDITFTTDGIEIKANREVA